MVCKWCGRTPTSKTCETSSDMENGEETPDGFHSIHCYFCNNTHFAASIKLPCVVCQTEMRRVFGGDHDNDLPSYMIEPPTTPDGFYAFHCDKCCIDCVYCLECKQFAKLTDVCGVLGEGQSLIRDKEGRVTLHVDSSAEAYQSLYGSESCREWLASMDDIVYDSSLNFEDFVFNVEDQNLYCFGGHCALYDKYGVGGDGPDGGGGAGFQCTGCGRVYGMVTK